MSDNAFTALLMEDNPGDVDFLRAILSTARHPVFHLIPVNRLATGLERIAKGDIDVILLDLSLPDSQGLDTFVQVYERAPETPIVVLTGLADEATAMQAIQKGAQDYLYKDQIAHEHMLARAVYYAIERKRIEIENTRLYEAMRSAISRAHVGQMLHDLRIVGGLSEAAMFRAGQALAARVAAGALPPFLEVFAAVGLGTLTLIAPQEGQHRWIFSGDGLMEIKAGSDQPTCNYTQGFLCGAVAHMLDGTRVAAAEVGCQSMGDALCRFVVQAMA